MNAASNIMMSTIRVFVTLYTRMKRHGELVVERSDTNRSSQTKDLDFAPEEQKNKHGGLWKAALLVAALYS